MVRDFQTVMDTVASEAERMLSEEIPMETITQILRKEYGPQITADMIHFQLAKRNREAVARNKAIIRTHFTDRLPKELARLEELSAEIRALTQEATEYRDKARFIELELKTIGAKLHYAGVNTKDMKKLRKEIESMTDEELKARIAEHHEILKEIIN